jgi:hypothetical protein
VCVDKLKRDVGILLGLAKHTRNLPAEDTVMGWLTNLTVQSNGISGSIGVAVDGRTFLQGVHDLKCRRAKSICSCDRSKRFSTCTQCSIHTCISSCADSFGTQSHTCALLKLSTFFCTCLMLLLHVACNLKASTIKKRPCTLLHVLWEWGKQLFIHLPSIRCPVKALLQLLAEMLLLCHHYSNNSLQELNPSMLLSCPVHQPALHAIVRMLPLYSTCVCVISWEDAKSACDMRHTSRVKKYDPSGPAPLVSTVRTCVWAFVHACAE